VATEKELGDVLGEFARTMVTDFPIQAILDQLVRRIVQILPITAAGVTLISSDLVPGMSPPRTARPCGTSSCRPSWGKARASWPTAAVQLFPCRT
jgi:hypothetical protein